TCPASPVYAKPPKGRRWNLVVFPGDAIDLRDEEGNDLLAGMHLVPTVTARETGWVSFLELASKCRPNLVWKCGKYLLEVMGFMKTQHTCSHGLHLIWHKVSH